MIQNFKRNIFLYNKKNELITYVDLDYNGKLYSYYSINNRILTKLNINKFKEKNKTYTEINKSKVLFGEDCKLFHTFLFDDSYCRAIKSNSTRIELPTVISTIHSHNDEFIEGYTINQSIMQDWSKKL